MTSLEEENKQAREKIVEQEKSLLDERKRAGLLETELRNIILSCEEEIRKQKGTIEKLNSSLVLELDERKRAGQLETEPRNVILR